MSPKPYYENPEQWLPEFRTMLNDLNLEWAIIGGVGAKRYRLVPRHTDDLDFVANRLTELMGVLEDRGLTFRVLRERDNSPYLLQGTTPDGMHFDIYEAHTDFEKSALERRIKEYATPEDIIVYKLMAWRPQDRDDVASMLAAQPNLDHNYIEHWAQAWDVLDSWHEALEEHSDKQTGPIAR
ncbi:MAG: hypothetical protein M1350_06835 [Actinobacteria bacterium]|jgi:hypothetical protein|nr:hypothetical protein [Actinomycetota bacterium]